MQGKREEAEAALTQCFDVGGRDWKLIALDEAVVAKLTGGGVRPAESHKRQRSPPSTVGDRRSAPATP